MAVKQLLVITEVFEYEESVAAEDALVEIQDQMIVIRPYESSATVRLSFSLTEWERIVDFVGKSTKEE